MGKIIRNKKEIGLYIHIPFCKAKCYYCDFNSFSGKEKFINSYFEAINSEIKYYQEKLENFKIKSVFIGGGTPTHVDAEYISKLIDLCKKSFDICSGAEISIESNPGTLSFDKLKCYKASGINRLSIGLQAFQNDTLKRIGRIHSTEQFTENFHQARKVGFYNINVDVIFGLPHQTLEEWNETLSKLAELNVEHISCYSLKIEENSEFGRKHSIGTIEPIDDEIDREMYYKAISDLTRNGLQHYEISNFSKLGFECKHNIIYWKAEEYLGIGAGAHSYLEGIRYGNISDIEEYIYKISTSGEASQNAEFIDINESMSEFMILGLRLIKGVNSSEFNSRYNIDLFKHFGSQLEYLTHKGLIFIQGNNIMLTKLGLDFANEVFVEFI